MPGAGLVVWFWWLGRDYAACEFDGPHLLALFKAQFGEPFREILILFLRFPFFFAAKQALKTPKPALETPKPALKHPNQHLKK